MGVRTLALWCLAWLGAACGAHKGAPASLEPAPSAGATSASAPIVATPPSTGATAPTSPTDAVPRTSGPLHLAATGPGPRLSWLMNVAGGPLLMTGQQDKIFAWNGAESAFTERPDLLPGITLETGGDIIGRMDGDLWFARRLPDSKTDLFRKPFGKPWVHVAALDGVTEIQPFDAKSILAKISLHKGPTHFEVFGDPPLPTVPKLPSTSSPCRLDIADAGFAAMADGSVVVGSECYGVWSPATGKATIKQGFGRAIVAIDRESPTSAVAFGESPDMIPILAHGNGASWAPIETSGLGKIRLRNAGRTADGSEWVIGEREGEEPRLFRQAANATQWERIPIAMGTTDPKEDEHTSVSMLTVVDGDVWIRAEHTVKIEGPYTYAIYTTRATKRVLVTP